MVPLPVGCLKWREEAVTALRRLCVCHHGAVASQSTWPNTSTHKRERGPESSRGISFSLCSRQTGQLFSLLFHVFLIENYFEKKKRIAEKVCNYCFKSFPQLRIFILSFTLQLCIGCLLYVSVLDSPLCSRGDMASGIWEHH